MRKWVKIGAIALALCLFFVFRTGQTKVNVDLNELLKKAKEVERLQLVLHTDIEPFEAIYKRFSPYLTDQFLQAYVNENAYLVEGVYRWKEKKILLIPRIDEHTSKVYEDSRHQLLYLYCKTSNERYNVLTYELQKGTWKISSVLTDTLPPPELKIQGNKSSGFWWIVTEKLKSLRIR